MCFRPHRLFVGSRGGFVVGTGIITASQQQSCRKLVSNESGGGDSVRAAPVLLFAQSDGHLGTLGRRRCVYGIKDHVLVGLERIGFSTTKQHWDQPDARNQSKQALLTGEVDDFNGSH